MNNGIDIITLPVDRWAEFRSLRLRALREHPDAFGEPVSRAESQPDSFWRARLREITDGQSWLVFADSNGRLVGMAGAFRPEPDVQPGLAIIRGVYVAPEARGRDVGLAMLTALLDQLRSAGITTARLWVNESQTAAVCLYERLGFRQVGREVMVLGDGMPHEELIMERSLP